MAKFSRPTYRGTLKAVVDEATTFVWILYPAQFLHTEVRSEAFQVGNDSYEFLIRKEVENIYITLTKDDHDDRMYYSSVRCALLTATGDSLGCVSHDLYHFTPKTDIFVMKPDELRRRIGNNQMLKLVATFFPERPFPLTPLEDDAGIYACERLSAVDEDCQGAELEMKTHRGVTAFWKPDLRRHYSLYNWPVSAPFDLGEDTFRIRIREDAHHAGQLFVGVQKVRLQTKSALTSIRLKVWTSENELLMRIFHQKVDFHMNESHEGYCISSRELDQLLIDGRQLRIVCSLFREDDDCLEHASRQGLNSLTRDMKELFLTGQDSDITIEVDNEMLSGHRAILSARCPVFANMLKHDMVERNSGVVKIPHYSTVEFKNFLLYLYSGRVESFTTEKALSLYRAADEYDVPDLKAECLEFLKRNLSVDTLGDVIALSLLHDEKELSHLAKEFFEEHALAVIKSASWKVFLRENIDVANEMYTRAFEASTSKTKRRKL